jgi:hypothetical protein
VRLKRLEAAEKIQWNHMNRERKPLEPSEAGAYDTLAAAIPSMAAGQEVTVTGPLKRGENGYEVHVRTFSF